MADAPPPPPRRGRLAVVVLLLATTLVIGGLLLKARPEPGPEPAEISPEPAPAADPQPIAYYLARGDAVRGEAYFTGRCGACHTVTQGGPDSIGPKPYGVFGQPMATGPGFAYSAALREKGGSWDWESTNHFLQMPRAFVPGTRMTFAGVLRPQDRADVMLWLNRQGGTLPVPAGAQ
jgi:cytochrome c